MLFEKCYSLFSFMHLQSIYIQTIELNCINLAKITIDNTYCIVYLFCARHCDKQLSGFPQ